MTNSRVGDGGLLHLLLHPFNSLGKAAFAGALAVSCCLLMGLSSAKAEPGSADVHGVTVNALGAPVPKVQISVHSLEDNTDRNIVSDNQGTFVVYNLTPGRYQLSAAKGGLTSPSPLRNHCEIDCTPGSAP
jgi:hypothetical protein